MIKKIHNIASSLILSQAEHKLREELQYLSPRIDASTVASQAMQAAREAIENTILLATSNSLNATHHKKKTSN